MLKVVPAVAAVAIAAALGCTTLPEAKDPLGAARDGDVGLPVLGFQWKRTIFDHTSDHKPQEFAAPAVSPEAADAGGHGRVFVGSHEGTFYALGAGDGRILWKQKVGSTSNHPIVDRGLVYLGTDEGTLVVMNAADGTVRWRYAAKGSILREPILVGDMVIFSTDADHVVALDRDTGKWHWQYDRETPDEFTLRGHAGVAAGGDHLYTGFADGRVVSLAAGTGEVAWVRSLAGDAKQFVDVDTTPIVTGGIVYAASSAGGLYALDASDGTERWRQGIKGAGELSSDGERLYAAAADYGLYALDLGGHVVWRQGFAHAGDPARPVIDGSYLLLSVSERGLYIIDKRSGTLLQYFDPGPGISSAPTVLGDRMYTLSNGGVLYAMDVRRF